MILTALIGALIGIFSALFSLFPKITVIPWGLDSVLVSAIGGIRSLIVAFPPLGVVIEALLIYAGFRLGLVILKIFLGSRLPAINNM